MQDTQTRNNRIEYTQIKLLSVEEANRWMEEERMIPIKITPVVVQGDPASVLLCIEYIAERNI